MKKYLFIGMPLVMAAFLITILPQSASAHEHYTFQIGDKTFKFVIGSLNEPITVDDLTGLDLRVSLLDDTNVEALDQTLKVELIAGDKKKVLDIEPVFRTPGAYKAKFYPTIATTLSYWIFGTINDELFDYTFTCNPAHPEGKENEYTEKIEVSSGVVQILKGGSFSCPQPKSGYGFPEDSASINDINTKATNLENTVDAVQARADSSGTMGMFALIAGLLGLIVGVAALLRGKKQ